MDQKSGPRNPFFSLNLKGKQGIKCGIILILMIDLYIIDVNSIIQMHTLYHI